MNRLKLNRVAVIFFMVIVLIFLFLYATRNSNQKQGSIQEGNSQNLSEHSIKTAEPTKTQVYINKSFIIFQYDNLLNANTTNLLTDYQGGDLDIEISANTEINYKLISGPNCISQESSILKEGPIKQGSIKWSSNIPQKEICIQLINKNFSDWNNINPINVKVRVYEIRPVLAENLNYLQGEQDKEKNKCNSNEIYSEKTNECYNYLDRIYLYEKGKVSVICSQPCPLSDPDFNSVTEKVKKSYSFIKDITEIEPRLEVEVRVNEKDSLCSAVYGWRITKFGDQILVICPNQIESNGQKVFPKITIEHELVHAFLGHRVGCLSFNEGLAKYLSEHLDKPDFFDSHEVYYLFKAGNITITDIRNSPHEKGFFFFLNLDEKVIFQRGASRILFNKIKEENDADCNKVKDYIGSIVDTSVVNELYQKYEID